MLNKVMLIGNLGSDPEVRYTPNGDAVGNFPLATNKRWKDRNGEQQERTEWHRIVCWRDQAENAAKYLTKGKKVYVEGEIQTRSWETDDGEKRYTTEVVARIIQFLDPPKEGSSGGGGGGRSSAPPPPDDDDLPF